MDVVALDIMDLQNKAMDQNREEEVADLVEVVINARSESQLLKMMMDPPR